MAIRKLPPITLVGHPLVTIGMGQHFRSVFRALNKVCVSASVLDLYGVDRPDPELDAEFSHHYTSEVGEGINIFCVNGDEIRPPEVSWKAVISRGYNIAFPAWELPRYPQVWACDLEIFDEVWTASEFTRRSIAQAISKPVFLAGLGCEARRIELHSRRRFKDSGKQLRFLFAYHFLSFQDRKNPSAVIQAFGKVVKLVPHADITLVVKTNNGSRRPDDYNRLVEELKGLGDRVVLIDETLNEGEMKCLLHLCDCFVSLHRSEGLGSELPRPCTCRSR